MRPLPNHPTVLLRKTRMLQNRHVFITGASSGIGERLARSAVAAGARVTLAARRLDRLSALAEALASGGGETQSVAMNAADEASVVEAFNQAERRFGPVDTVYANAGISVGGFSLDMDIADFDSLFAVNVRGSFLTARQAARSMIAAGSAEREHGRIVLVASVGAQIPLAGLTAYCASKAAVVALGRNLAREWAREGINVNVVCPGYVETEMTQDWFASPAGERQRQRFVRKRLMAEGGLDPMFLLLGSDAAHAMTGGVHVVDDGQSLS